MKVLRILLMALAFVSLQAHANDGRNLTATHENTSTGDKRIALVIGNSGYTTSPLKNPINDAKDIAKKLRGLGFDVIERSDLKTKQIGGTLSEFRSKLSSGAVALVFYAGHGLQINGENYLPAVDADINAEEDVQNQSLSVRQIMDVLDKAKTRLNLVFLDACRNNPYASRSFRSVDRGLARVSAPSGTLISYATKPGSVAADGDGRNGLYTSKLLAQMDSNIQIELTLKRVVTEVKAASKGKQEPWMEGSIEGDFCFAGCAASGGTQVASLVPVPAQVHIKSKEEIEQGAWESVRDSGNISSIQEYLTQYPKGRYVGQARILITTLKTAPVKFVEPVARDDGDMALWIEVEKSNTKEDYQAYLVKYPKGKYDALAKGRLKKFEEEDAQQTARLQQQRQEAERQRQQTIAVRPVANNTAQQAIAAVVTAKLGKDYRLLNPPQSTSTKKIEVLEFFFYGCSHCFHLHPHLSAWEKTIPKDVELIYVPTIFRDSWEPMARTFYALEFLGQQHQLHDALYKAWNVDNDVLGDEAKILDFVAPHGVDRAKFSAAYNSSLIQSEVTRAKQMIRSYGITGTPTLIVDGKYLITGLQPEETIRVLNEMIAMARKEHKHQ